MLHLLVLKAARPGIKVMVVDQQSDRLDLARELGADAAAEPGDAALDAVADLSDGTGADAVFDTVGGAGPLRGL